MILGKRDLALSGIEKPRKEKGPWTKLSQGLDWIVFIWRSHQENGTLDLIKRSEHSAFSLLLVGALMF